MKIVRISASWCSSCIITYNDFLKLKNKFPLNEYVELDYDFDDVSSFNVGNVLPIIIGFIEDKEVFRLEGEVSLKEIEEKL